MSDLMQSPTGALNIVDAQENILSSLESAAQAQDERTYYSLLEKIDWEQRPAGDYVRAIRSALLIGAFITARSLSMEGMEQHPDDEIIKGYAAWFAPAKARIVERSKASSEQFTADRDWLREHSDSYRGRWVALRSGELLGVADSPKQLIEQIDEAWSQIVRQL